jgi:hypothetical protein
VGTFKNLLHKNESLPKNIREVYKIIADKENSEGIVDGINNGHTIDEIETIKGLLYDEVKANYVKDNVSFQSLDELRNDLVYKIQVKDGFYNPVTGIGDVNDPSLYDNAYTPISLTPWEATAQYSSGGLSKVVIDKKSRGLLINGFSFEGDLAEDDFKILKEYALSKGFDRAMLNAIRDGLIYGGSVLYPYFKKDTPISTPQSLDELMESGILDKDCIDYFITVDRWNSVVVPNYNLTARDYLMPSNFYVPLGGMQVNTKRAAIMKPNPLPYWGAIRQLGWGVSDYEGYIRSLLSYEIMIQTLPIMFQQMSILFQVMPLDSILAMNGPGSVKDFVNANEAKMREWSMVNPKAINSFGDVKVLERHYQGFMDMFMVKRQDFASKCNIPESVIFHTQPTGFSDNKEDVVLKQSEAVKMIEPEITASLSDIIKVLLISCFGKNAEQVNKKVDINFSNPIVPTDTEKSEQGVKFSQFVNTLYATGMPLDIIINQARQFFPNYQIDEEDMERISEITETQEVPEGGLNNKEPSLLEMLKNKDANKSKLFV